MSNSEISILIITSLTLIASIVSAILSYKLQSEKKRVKRLEAYYKIAIENLQANYEIEKYLANRLNTTHKKLQNELRNWMQSEKIELKRDYYSPNFLKKELNKLKTND